MGMTQSLWRLAGLDWPVPDYIQHGQPAAKDLSGSHRRCTDHDRLASAGGQHGHQDAGRRRMEDEKARPGVSSPMVQGAPREALNNSLSRAKVSLFADWVSRAAIF
jgi:hypothetical protein